MEKFKACEKEMKTKAFSKEGLIQSAKLDPKAQEKLETTQWVQTQVEELLLQVEQAEAEIETLQGGGKKKNKAGGAAAERLEGLEHLNERRKWHISRLEIILRLLDNGTLPTEKVFALKDDVSYFVESNTVRSLVILCSSWTLLDTPGCRKKISTRMRAYMMNLTSMKKKRSLAWRMMMRAMSPTRQAMVSLYETNVKVVSVRFLFRFSSSDTI